MSKILRIGWKDLLVIFSDRAALLLIIGGPLLLTVGMGLITGSFGAGTDSGINQIPVTVINADEGALGQALVDVMTGDELAELLAITTESDLAVAREAASQGEIAAAVWIPDGFSAGLLPDPATGQTADPEPVIIYGDPGRPISTGMVESIVDQFTSEVATDVLTVRLAMDDLVASGMAPAQLPTAAQTVQAAVTGDTLNASSGVSLIRETTTREQSTFNPLAYFAPAMALLFLMYTVTLGARSFLVERNRKTLARVLASPIQPGQVIGGKVLGIFLSGFVQVGFLIALSALLFGLRWGNPLGVVLIVALAALAATGWGMLVSSLATTPAQVSAIGTSMMLGFGILGGSFIPINQSSAVLTALSKLTPNAWALDGFVALAQGDGLAGIAVTLGALALMAAILFVLSAVIFRRRQSTLLAG